MDKDSLHRLQPPLGTTWAAAVLLLSGLGDKFPKVHLQPEVHIKPFPIASRLGAITQLMGAITQPMGAITTITNEHAGPCQNSWIQSL